ncbi:hypothetical protein [Hyphobacterium sp.]|uniref:hypothetical protein n=1 Tax=Hyphobacterium sp. TaxID=2004662 RepID=UPI003B52EC55
MAKRDKTGRRLFLKAAAALGLSGAASAAGAQETRPIIRRPVRPTTVLPTARSGASVSRGLAVVRRGGNAAMTEQASNLLRRDSLVSNAQMEETVSLVREVVGQLNEDFRGVVRMDIAVGPDGEPSQFSCGSNHCGSNTCGANECASQTCGTQSCGVHSCTSNTVASATSGADIPAQARQQWQVLQMMQQNMQFAFVELNIIQLR